MFPERLRGMFAIAVWDQKRQRGVIARDRLGIKPLYYADCGDPLVFASELKSLLASGLVPTELDYEAIDAYLTLGFFPAPATPLAAVKKLEPGCLLVIENGRVEQRRYWSYPQPTLERGGSVEEWSERLLAKLEESVRMRLMSDVPLGAMLSGGLDSSLIVALMAQHDGSPGADLRGRVLGGRRGQRARRRALRRRRRSAPTTTSSSSRSRRRRSRSTTSSGISTSRSPTFPRSASSPSRGSPRSTSPSRSPARARTSSSAATGSTAQPRSPARGSGCPRRCGRRCSRRRRTARRACAGRSTRSRPPDPAERLLAMSGALDARAAERARARPARRARRQRGAPRDLVPPRRSSRRAAAGGALPRRAARPRRRHAPLLRPRVDGALARGARARSSTTSSSSSARRCRPIAEGPPPRDEARAPPRGARPRAGPDHRQAEDRLLQLGRRRLVPRADARRDQRLPARPEPALRGDDRPRRGRAARQEPRRPERLGQRVRAALDPDARGLARGVPAARARAATAARERIVA